MGLSETPTWIKAIAVLLSIAVVGVVLYYVLKETTTLSDSSDSLDSSDSSNFLSRAVKDADKKTAALGVWHKRAVPK